MQGPCQRCGKETMVTTMSWLNTQTICIDCSEAEKKHHRYKEAKEAEKARKAAEADLISRREETAAMRSQANTAKLLENNPALTRLRELEILEQISRNSKLNVVLGEKGLTDRIVNLL